MKKIFKGFTLIFVGLFFIFIMPAVKIPGTCGLTIPFLFTGSILGCGGDKDSTMQSQDVALKNKSIEKVQTNDAQETKEEIKVTFIELGSINCLPCRMMQPVIQEVERKYKGQVKVISYDVLTPEGREEAYKYKIRVIPTQIFLDRNNKEYFRHEGFFTLEDIEKVLKEKGVK